MRKIIVSLLFVILSASGGQEIFSQSGRAKRIEERTAKPVPIVSQTPAATVKAETKPADANRNQPLPDASNQPETVGDDEVLRVETNLVTVPVTVSDRNGRYIPDLRKEDFHVYENGVEREIAFFASVDKPFTVVLLLDTSGSVTSSLESIKRAAKVFVDQMRVGDRAAVITFARDWHVLTEPTDDRERLYEAIDSMTPEPWTRLYDTVDYVLSESFKNIEGRKAVILLTDGVDARSRNVSAKKTIRRAEEGEPIFYTIRYTSGHFANQSTALPPAGRGLPFPFPFPGRKTPQNFPDIILRRKEEMERTAEDYLKNLAEKTGGRYQAAQQVRDIETAFALVAEELRHQYNLGFYPNRAAREETRQIGVRVDKPNLAVRNRTTYIAHPQKDAAASAAKK